MTHTEHTPTPWTVGGSAHDWHRIHRKAGEDCGPVVAKCYGTRGERNPDAELIVRCVNSHERLIQALSELVAEHDVSNEDIPMGYGPKPDTFGIELARAALAEGETP